MSSSKKNYTKADYDELFGTPEKMRAHIESLNEERQELMRLNRFLLRILWFSAIHAGDENGGGKR